MSVILNLLNSSVLSVTIGVIGAIIYFFAFSNLEYKSISFKEYNTKVRTVVAFFGILLIVIGVDGIAP
ncbi:hypothetical protein [uncultured Methanolobus sp.]|uniref:hypothetical protein n=1 Tax=uncultured Methanolobus sp. TaxID=218300 RepID=UPI002AAAC66F|nr:hypothetical protein [uncultured Methanolobus sp.]